MIEIDADGDAAAARWLPFDGGKLCADDSTALSGTQRCFEFVLSPPDRFVELFAALRELGHHHGIDRLVVDLRADFRARRRTVLNDKAESPSQVTHLVEHL